ncbi:MAG: hypothetical protein A2W25_06375 [candidate division Zixibacteria bacterium RBG_16_53_22]|nr:MAG: hypothetical protein A2W25_06375 [candidate division Zixibacteria bacterium RBG_16_53_22]
MKGSIGCTGWAALLIIAIISPAAASDFVIDVLPNGARYYSSKIIVMNENDSPPYQTGVSSAGIAYAGVPSVDGLCRQCGVVRIEPFYPGNLRNSKLARLAESLYIFTLADDLDASDLLEKFTADPNIKLADLYSAPELCYIPNDPDIIDQWHLNQVFAYQAWDIVRGDTTRHSVIGIIDTGVHWDHPDLTANIWINDAEDVNDNGLFDPADNDGIDADSNGFVDDVVGWDFGANDNDPVDDALPHGTAVAGCASEVTDNGLRGAAIGFSARVMCVNAFQGGMPTAAYQGMLYAADNGANIVNCSWAVRGQYSQAEQDIINALYDADVMIIASAGAYSDTVRAFPAAYDHVMAVASTDRDDHRATFSSYGSWVDICAPGVDILTTYGQNQMFVYSGTSFSNAQVSGLVAIIRAWYPQMPGDFVETLIEITADTIPNNNGLLGGGRINCYNALSLISASDPTKPEALSLAQNYPNPFNASTIIRYVLPAAADVVIEIYDIMGRRVETLVDAIQEAGAHSVVWSPGNSSSGVYFYRLIYDGESRSMPMIYAR